jgi:hypothetical protein
LFVIALIIKTSLRRPLAFKPFRGAA